MQRDRLTRRLLLQGSGALAARRALELALPGVSALAAAACSARDEEARFAVLAAAEAREFEAIAGRIIPTTDTPGAREAGVIHFMDKAFASLMREELAPARRGLGILQTGLGGQRFSELGEERQDAELAAIDDTDFFRLMRTMTIYGFFGMSQYGGNRNNAGLRLLGVDEPRHAWQAPFGYYDEEALRGNSDGE